MTTKKEIGKWIVEAKEAGAKYLIVAYDWFDYTNYPIACYGKKETYDSIERIREKEDTVMEVYNLSRSIKKQLDEKRAWNIEA